jgi:hypothetical protein
LIRGFPHQEIVMFEILATALVVMFGLAMLKAYHSGTN